MSSCILIFHMPKSVFNQQERKERKKRFLDREIEPMTIDDAMAALLEVAGKQFKNNVELYGAVHTDELR